MGQPRPPHNTQVRFMGQFRAYAETIKQQKEMLNMFLILGLAAAVFLAIPLEAFMDKYF